MQQGNRHSLFTGHSCPSGHSVPWAASHRAEGTFRVPLCVLSHFSHVQLFVTPWTVAHQAPLSMGFSRQEYWSGLPCPPPGDLPDPGIKPESFTSPALAGGFFTISATREAKHPPSQCFFCFKDIYIYIYIYIYVERERKEIWG